MKKIIASLSAMFICLLLVACSNSKGSSTVRYESIDNGVESIVEFEVQNEKVLKEALSIQKPFSAMGATDKKSAKEIVKKLKQTSKDKTMSTVIDYQVTDKYIEVITTIDYQIDKEPKENDYPTLKNRVESYKMIGYKEVKK